jgi:hypothetical protein
MPLAVEVRFVIDIGGVHVGKTQTLPFHPMKGSRIVFPSHDGVAAHQLEYCVDRLTYRIEGDTYLAGMALDHAGTTTRTFDTWVMKNMEAWGRCGFEVEQ